MKFTDIRLGSKRIGEMRLSRLNIGELIRMDLRTVLRQFDEGCRALATRIVVGRRGEKVGTDSLGNIYYKLPAMPGNRRERRWVIYPGEAEASDVPPEWHAWLHHMSDTVPGPDNPLRRRWQKPHVPNQTGTPDAYRPPGHVLEGGRRDPATGDYEAWVPE